MTPMPFLCASLACFAAGGFGSLVLGRHETAAIRVAGLFGMVAGVFGILAGAGVLAGPPAIYDTAGPFPFARFVLRLDGLSGLMVVAISALATVASIYSFAYVRDYSGKGVGAMGFFLNLFVASMLLVVVADNAFWFLIFFEMMSLSSYFLVVFDQEDEAIAAGFIYFLMAHAGSMAIMAAFFLMANAAGSFDFAAFRALHPTKAVGSIAFVLALLGFGAKAGMVPMHGWLPRAHPAAPSHASALMSGVMIKVGIFGILKVGVDLLGGGVLWWGIVVLAFGAVSAVVGVTYALQERDIKRLLAYSSVENVGVILLGIGTGMIGFATGHPIIAALGLLAGLYHLVSHALFKGLLFLGAGAVIHAMHTKNMNSMGGLARSMPWTSLCFLVGALAICALPPLSGFVSEWFTYQGLFAAALDGTVLVRFVTPIAATMLALTGALAAMCFVKAYGEVFSGAGRSQQAEQAREAPAAMLAGMVPLAIGCVLLGLAAPLAAPLIGGIATGILHIPALAFADGAMVLPGGASPTLLSTPLIGILLVGLAVFPLLLVAVFARSRPAARRAAAPWAAGYLPDAHMAVTGHSFTQPIRMFFAPFYRAQVVASAVGDTVERRFGGVVQGARLTEPMFERILVTPAVAAAGSIGRRLQVLQGGNLSVSCLYIVAALAVLLLLTLA